jgi:hypothetical protein
MEASLAALASTAGSMAKEEQNRKNDPVKSPEETLVLSAREMKTQQEARKLFEDTKARFVQFESKLTPSDIDFITQPNPEALARRTHALRVTGECTAEQYAAIREKVGSQRLSEVGDQLVGAAVIYEAPYTLLYRDRELQLLDSDDRYRDYLDLSATIFSGQPSMSHFSGDEAQSRIQEMENVLAKRGFEQTSVRGFVLDLAARWPTCLGYISMPFFNFWRNDATAIRGAALLGKLREFVGKNHKIPAGVEGLVVADSPFLRDAWYNSFQIAASDKSLRLFSVGPDGKENTDDDIAIGEVPIPAPAPMLPRQRKQEITLDRDTWTKGAATILTAGRIGIVSSGGCRVDHLEPDGFFVQLGLREEDLVLRTNLGAPRSIADCFRIFSGMGEKALRSITVRGAETWPVNLRLNYR